MQKARSSVAAFLLAATVLTGSEAAMATDSAVDSLMAHKVTYEAHLTRDPYALPAADAEETAIDTKYLDLQKATLVGLIGGSQDYMALVEDENAEGYALRKGDRIKDGEILEISDSFISAWIRVDGIGQRIRLDLVQEGD